MTMPPKNAAQQQAEKFFSVSLDLMCVVGTDGYLKQINPMWTQLLGWSESELLSQPVLNIVHPEDQPVLIAARDAVREGHESGRIEIRYQRKNGSYCWIWWRVFPQLDQQVIYAIGRDISDQKRDEAFNEGHKAVLEMIAVGRALSDTLYALLALIETDSPELKCSILLLDADGKHLNHGAAASLPAEYCKAINGIPIGPRAGSCGTAAYTQAPVIVEDIATDPLWQGHNSEPLKYGLRACWSTPIFDMAHQVLGTFGIYYDKPALPASRHRYLIRIVTQTAAIAITQHRDQTQLKLSEEKFTTIFRHAPVWMAITNMDDGTYVDANDHALNAAGYSRDEIIGRTAAELGWLKPNERQLFLDEISKYGRIRGMEMTFHNRAGQPLYGLVTGHQVMINGKPCLLTVSVDISERRRVEQALREREDYLDKIINNVGDPLFVKDEQHRFVMANDAFCLLFDLPRSRIIGVALDEQTPPEQREHFWRIDKQVLDTGEDNVTEELLTIREGITRIISTRKTRYMDDSGNRYVIGVIHDLTERKQLEAQLLQAQKMEAIGTLAGGIAHDFNNILTAITGYSQLAMADAKGHTDQQKYLNAVLQGAHRATQLVKQITTFSRQHDAQLSPQQLPKIVAEALMLLRAMIPTTIEIKSTLKQQVRTVMADPTQIHQIVMNLCTNAWHAMKSTPGKISVYIEDVIADEKLCGLHAELHPGQYVRLRVSDTGSGMDPNIVTRIFEPFFTTKAPGEGSGLGLAVVHGIMRAHHGAIVVNSTPHLGTTFDLYFPAHTDRDFTDTQQLPASHELFAMGHQERILLVDDENALVQLSTRILEKAGYQVSAYASSREALTAFFKSAETYHLVVTDLTMPDLSGIELATQVRQVRPDIPIIVVSGNVDDDAQEKCAAAGINKVLLKPYTMDSLVQTVQQILSEGRSS